MTKIKKLLLELVLRASFLAIRWETPFTPCAGITAVLRQERRAFRDAGLVIAPWEPRMASAKRALASGQVEDHGHQFRVNTPEGEMSVRVLTAQDPNLMPILFLEIDGFFQGTNSPYDTQALESDAIVFALAVARLLNLAVAGPRQWVWGADWESVPALLLLRERHHIVLHLHNIYDAKLADQARRFAFPEPSLLLNSTALEAGLRVSDVVATVNRGFLYGLRNEIFHTKVMGSHLQQYLGSAVPVENAAFEALSPELLELQQLLAENPEIGLKRLSEMKTIARRRLPEDVQKNVAGKLLACVMGRRATQKLHDGVVEAAQLLLQRNPELPLFFFFATVHGDATSDHKLNRIRNFCKAFPKNAAFSDGHLSYFNDLLNAADFNIMLSLFEPHGGAFQGTVLPIARAIDGLAAQIPALQPVGLAAKLNGLWHGEAAPAAGWTFREPEISDQSRAVAELEELLNGNPSPSNQTYRGMVHSFAETVEKAVFTLQIRPDRMASLTQRALTVQSASDWKINYGGMFSHVAGASLRRPIS